MKTEYKNFKKNESFEIDGLKARFLGYLGSKNPAVLYKLDGEDIVRVVCVGDVIKRVKRSGKK